MSVVTVSHAQLARARRDLERAYHSSDWDGVRRCDRQLGHHLNLAFADEHRDTRALVDELEKVLSLYADMVLSLPAEVANKLSPPG